MSMTVIMMVVSQLLRRDVEGKGLIEDGGLRFLFIVTVFFLLHPLVLVHQPHLHVGVWGTPGGRVRRSRGSWGQEWLCSFPKGEAKPKEGGRGPGASADGGAARTVTIA